MPGKELEVELYENKSGKVPVKDFLNNCDVKIKAKTVELMEWLEKYGVNKLLQSQHAKELKGIRQEYDLILFELRPKQARILFWIQDDKAIMLHAFSKKEDRIPERHIKKALKRIHQLNST